MSKSILYVIPNYECNLKCSHCDIKDLKCEYNEEALIKAITENTYDEVILFGGEPTLYYDRLKACIDTGKITSITTNLIGLTSDKYDLIKDLHVTTSWNPSRFNPIQYSEWLDNIEKFEDLTVLVTLTPELISIDPLDFLKKANEWNVSGILFEQLISDKNTEKHFNDVDKWLCNITDKWNIKADNLILDRVNNWYFDCDNTYTLRPDGEFVFGCPHGYNVSFTQKCLSCSKSLTCRPCKLQSWCSFPEELYRKVNSHENSIQI